MISMSPDHVYTLTLPGQEPRILPSNTQILKDRGVIDTTYYKPEHAQRGRDVHNLADFWNKQRMLGNDIVWETVDPRYVGYLRGWAKFCMETGFRAHLSEQPLWHSADFATTIDAFGYIAGSSALWMPSPTEPGVLVEIKTGSFPKWVWLQMALQELALIERARDGFVKIPGESQFFKLSQYPRKVCVVLSADGKYKVHEGFNHNHTGDALAHVRSYHSAREYA